MRAPKKTALYRAYCVATRLALPIAFRKIDKKLHATNVPEDRRRERLGYATQPRPQGPVYWFHAASVGESLSVLALIEHMGKSRPELSFLITSGTATSAELVEQRKPPRTTHQYAPLDAQAPLERFLDHWKPSAAIFVESELWPQMILRSADAGIPLALVNARLSEKSLEGWAKWPKTAEMVMGAFSVIMTQNAKMSEALITLGAPRDRIRRGFDLKATAAPLPKDDGLVKKMRSDLGARAVWVAASTHDGEEEVVLEAHKILLEKFPDLCLILAPRHPNRAARIRAIIEDIGLHVAQRSRGENLNDAQVYLADTLGELGSWYAVAQFVFLGGSLSDIGGHNPFEAAHQGRPVLSGPYVRNFADTFAQMKNCGAAVITPTRDDIVKQAQFWLSERPSLLKAEVAAAGFASTQTDDKLDGVASLLFASLEHEE